MRAVLWSNLAHMLPGSLRANLYPAAIIARLMKKRPRGYQNYLLSMVSEKFHLGKALGKPVSITIEPTNVCNLQCPVCETGAGILGRKPQMMRYEDFVKIMEKVGPGANHVMFYYMGESFLNKDAYRMIRYAREMGLYVETCTNGDYVDPAALYDSGINRISFQIGGITQEVHQVYRRNSDLSRVLRNLESYLGLIREGGRNVGEHEVELGMIVMRQNEAEIDRFLGLAKELRVKATLINPCVRTPQQAREFLPESDSYWIYEREIFNQSGRLVPKRVIPYNYCPWLYYAITIQVDGSVVPCCRDPHGKYIMGNLLSEPLDEIWNGPKFRRLRKLVSRRQNQLPLCSLCPGEGPPALK
jgi:radical SAM protein with 4Fe4S-binding SPASM domain